MPKIRRQNLSPALLQHLLDRIQQREISANQLGLLAIWLDQNPGVPAGQWFNPETAVETRRSRRARRRKPSCGRGSFVTHQVSVARVKLSLFLLRDLRALRVSIAVFRFKQFPGMTVCGEGELVRTFLTVAQTPIGDEIL